MSPDAARAGADVATGDAVERPWAVEAAEVVEALDSDARHGLSYDEARRRLEEYGPNEVATKGGPGALVRFLLQFHQPLIYILIVAGAVTAVLGEYVDSAVIFGVVVLNAVFTLFPYTTLFRDRKSVV